ncbi:MAG: hypothetical protein NZM11_02900, partial [Anaerolineales bacterium]|nr:hypothetical protein [Anaerolineales bacterium]
MATRALPSPASDFQQLVPLAVLLALALLAVLWPAEQSRFPAEWNLGLRQPIDNFQRWVIDNRATHPAFVYFFEPLRNFIDAGLRWTEGV